MSSFEDILLSPQFTFLIGREKKTIVVHANAIAATCSQMNALINGHMNEANTRCAEIENIEVEDFIRFGEFAYRGDFTVPNWTQDETLEADEERPDAPPEEPPVEDVPYEIADDAPAAEPEAVAEPSNSDWGPWRTAWQTKSQKQRKNGPKAKIEAQSSPYANEKPDQDFTPVFLANAHLYTFAHFRSIEPLKALTLTKLHSTLKKFKLYSRRVGDIIKLAECAYTADDLPSRSENGTIDPLRRLVVEYIACEISAIGGCREFVGLLEEGGEFVGDFLEDYEGVSHLTNYVVRYFFSWSYDFVT
ncbi:hypothetical protein K458DRAFT_395723 [Lentithecium fluviatile CBS 122367]|uniref:BTB domain-containing protein n=1 Tax=Lentithecium fluviatile CBS 122367 TaxID=1168545 RepID=A0A6G1II40_9PLEO|nr:hypothetical protein K458DRAFT_395723 [Lentithecium fluviatile CBS 122367]